MSSRDKLRQRDHAIQAIQPALWILFAAVPFFAWFLPLSEGHRLIIAGLALFSLVFLLFLYRWIVPRFGARPRMIYFVSLYTIVYIAVNSFLLVSYDVHLEILYMAVIAVAGILAGKRIALGLTLLAVLADIGTMVLGVDQVASIFIILSLHTLVFLITGYFVSTLAGIIHQQIQNSSRRNRDLAVLLEVERLVTDGEKLFSALPKIAEVVVKNLPASMCRISLLNADNHKLVTRGVYPLEPIDGWAPQIGETHALKSLPKHYQALEKEDIVVKHRQGMGVILSRREEEMLFFRGINTICLVPLVHQDERIGILAVGDKLRWDDKVANQEKVNLLRAMAADIAAAVRHAALFREVHRQAERLAMLNEVAKAIGSTIELDDLLELIYEQLCSVLPSDTYFVSLYDRDEQVMNIRVLYDEGERFPPTKVPMGKGLAGYVMENRKALLVRNLSVEIDTLPVKPVILGQDRVSESWLGVPMIAGEQNLGLLAIACYEPFAFDEDDITLLSNVASQAALAIDNARQHAEVKERARRDSLTGAYNHGHFLRRLDEEVARSVKEGSPVSLIMLDIDYFKKYNDTYGHVIGDEVLCLLVKAIQAHVKKTDIVGRWGGEEFAIALPGATKEEAMVVADRVRSTLAKLVLYDRSGNPIPKPTVSQGIANFPVDVQTAAHLVDLADKALYTAKNRGRDQVQAAVELCR